LIPKGKRKTGFSAAVILYIYIPNFTMYVEKIVIIDAIYYNSIHICIMRIYLIMAHRRPHWPLPSHQQT